jgi:hypothetical protein
MAPGLLPGGVVVDVQERDGGFGRRRLDAVLRANPPADLDRLREYAEILPPHLQDPGAVLAPGVGIIAGDEWRGMLRVEVREPIHPTPPRRGVKRPLI